MCQKTSCSSFFTLHSASASLRRGRISVPSIASEGINTPCLLIRTSRFLPSHLTPDNLDHTVPADSSILEMNFDFIVENEAVMKNSPFSIAELAGVAGKRAVCLATRVNGTIEKKTSNLINGDDFVTVQNSSGSNKFDLKLMESILARFKPDFFIGAFDEHSVPMSLKRVRKAVDRNLKYDKISESSSEKLELPFISSISGAEVSAEKERNIAGISKNSSGVAFCDLHKLSTFEERLSLLKGVCEVPERQGLLRIVRGSVSPSEMLKYLPYADMFDTTFVDEVTAKGHAIVLNFSALDGESESLDLWDEKYFEDFAPISRECDCHTCKNYNRSYVHHLLKSHEMLAGVLLMMHNLFQYSRWLEHLKAQA